MGERRSCGSYLCAAPAHKTYNLRKTDVTSFLRTERRFGRHMRKAPHAISALALAVALAAGPASAGAFFFTTGAADGRLGSLSQPAGPTTQETVRPGFETADDFALASAFVVAPEAGRWVAYTPFESHAIHRVYPPDPPPRDHF